MTMKEYLEKKHKLMDIVQPLVEEAYPIEKCASMEASGKRQELTEKLYKMTKDAYEAGKSA